MRITRNNTVDDNEIRVDESKVASSSKLVDETSKISSKEFIEVSDKNLKSFIPSINYSNYVELLRLKRETWFQKL